MKRLRVGKDVQFLRNRRKTSDFGNSWDLDRAGPEDHREELSFYPEMKSLWGRDPSDGCGEVGLDQVEVRRKASGEKAEGAAGQVRGGSWTGVEVGKRREAAGLGCVFEADTAGLL